METRGAGRIDGLDARRRRLAAVIRTAVAVPRDPAIRGCENWRALSQARKRARAGDTWPRGARGARGCRAADSEGSKEEQRRAALRVDLQSADADQGECRSQRASQQDRARVEGLPR